MTYIENICRTFNFTYLDFLETNLFKSYTEIVSKNSIKQFLALSNGELEDKRSDTDFFNSAVDGTYEMPSIDLQDSFYLGHFEIKSLMNSQEGINIIFEILEHRANQFKKIYTLFENLKADILKNNPDFYIKDFEKRFIEKYNQKNIEPYQEFLKFYNDKFNRDNPKYAQFFNTYKADKESFINFVLAHNKPTQTFFKKKLETYIPNKERYKHT